VHSSRVPERERAVVEEKILAIVEEKRWCWTKRCVGPTVFGSRVSPAISIGSIPIRCGLETYLGALSPKNFDPQSYMNKFTFLRYIGSYLKEGSKHANTFANSDEKQLF
jgi:hypothetical protein